MDSPGTMVAAVLYGPQDVRMEEVPIPGIAPDEILARVDVASADFTDRKVFVRGAHPMITVPGLFGHEWAGTVVEVGPAVAGGFRPGMRVVAANSAPCESEPADARCHQCRRGRQSMCEDLLYNNGAFAPFIRIPGRIVRMNLRQAPAGVPLEEVALAEPLACALHAVRRIPLAGGEAVGIVGAGPMGLLLAAGLRFRYGGALRIIALDHHDDRLRVAKAMGADECLNTAGGDPARMVREVLGRGADVAIEAVGSAEAHREALDLLGRGGCLVSFGGVKPGIDLSVDIGRLHYEELGILPIYHHTPGDFAQAVEAIGARAIPVARLITARLPLRELPRALQMIAQRTTLRPVLLPQG